MDSGELPLVKIQIKHAGDLPGVLHAEEYHPLILLRRDRLRLRIQRDEFAGAVFCTRAVPAERLCSIQQFLTGRGREAPCLSVFRYAVCSAGNSRIVLYSHISCPPSVSLR